MDEPFQMLVSSIDYNEFVGRIAIGRIERGTLKQNQEIAVCNYHDPEAVLRKATREIIRAHMAACVTDAVAAKDAGAQIDELVDLFDKMTR